MKYLLYQIIFFILLMTACSTEEASEHERTNTKFYNDLGGDLCAIQWWRTTVALKVDVTTDAPVKLILMSSEGD